MQIRIGRSSVLLLLPFFVSVCASPPRGVVILCAGDSLTAKAYPHFLQRLLHADGIAARVLNYGISGNTSQEYLEYLRDPVREEGLQWDRPDIILLQLGTNDVRVDGDFVPVEKFVVHMREILKYFQKFISRTADPSQIVLAVIPPIPSATPFPFSPESQRRVVEEINPAIRELAREFRLPLVDNYGIFVGRPDLLPGVHPTREGFRRMAENWHDMVIKVLKERKQIK
jgi:lysophospholipase L1-like esterase